MKCEFYSECPSCSAWCNNSSPDGNCVGHILAAFGFMERRLKHLLKSDFISSFDQKKPSTGEYARDIAEADKLALAPVKQEPKIFYLCDRKKCEGCGPDCEHTSDVCHAANFRRFAVNNDISFWEEKKQNEDQT